MIASGNNKYFSVYNNKNFTLKTKKDISHNSFIAIEISPN